MAERPVGFLVFPVLLQKMSGELPEAVSRDQLLLLAVTFSKAISVLPLHNSGESFAWGKALVPSVAFFQLL